MKTENCSNICPGCFGLALGIVWGVAILATGLIAMHFNWAGKFIEVMASVYVGYGTTVKGSFIGALWGFLDAFIGGFILIWLYNVIGRCCKKCCGR